MEKKTIFIFIVLVFFLGFQQGIAQPIVSIDQPVFTFKAVPEGVHVPHEFIIKNTGDTLLHINNVLPP